MAVNKQLIVEDQSFGSLKLDDTNKKRKGTVGKITGTFADFKNPTRNGRLYGRQLWENVLKSDNFKEAMATKTCFGENGHPADRSETDLNNVSLVLTDLKIDDNKGKVLGEADILDTPPGRILKSLLDYGCSIGVSSRGLGEEILKEGVSQIDPNTYDFICFDAVVQPAVREARPVAEMYESVDRKRMTLLESVKRELKEAKSSEDINSIKKYVKESGVISDEELNIDQNIGGEDTLPEIDIEAVMKENESLKAELEACNTRAKEMNSLLESSRNDSIELVTLYDKTKSENNKELKKVNSELNKSESFKLFLQSKTKSLKEEVERLRNENSKLTKTNETLNESVSSYKKENSKLKENLHIAVSNGNKLVNSNKSLNEELKTLKEINKSLNESLETSENKLSDEKNLNENLQNELNKLKIERQEKLTESKNLSNLTEKKLSKSLNYVKEINEAYLRTKSVSNGVKMEEALSKLPENYSYKDVDKVVKELVERNERFDKVAFADIDLSNFFVESSSLSNNETITEEDQRRINTIKSVNKK